MDSDSTHNATKVYDFSFLGDSNSFNQVDHSNDTNYFVQTSKSSHLRHECSVINFKNCIHSPVDLCTECHTEGRDLSNTSSNDKLASNGRLSQRKSDIQDSNKENFNTCFSQVCVSTGSSDHNVVRDSSKPGIGSKVLGHTGLMGKGNMDKNNGGINVGDNSGVDKFQPCNLKKNTDNVLVNEVFHCVNTSKRNTPYVSRRPNYLGCRIALQSNFNLDLWKSKLTHYHDQHVVNLIQFGFPLGIGDMRQLVRPLLITLRPPVLQRKYRNLLILKFNTEHCWAHSRPCLMSNSTVHP